MLFDSIPHVHFAQSCVVAASACSEQLHLHCSAVGRMAVSARLFCSTGNESIIQILCVEAPKADMMEAM